MKDSDYHNAANMTRLYLVNQIVGDIEVIDVADDEGEVDQEIDKDRNIIFEAINRIMARLRKRIELEADDYPDHHDAEEN